MEVRNIKKWDLWNYVEDYLTDYSDNFVGAPDSEIIEEVLEEVDDDLSEKEIIKQIEEICSNKFDQEEDIMDKELQELTLTVLSI